MRRLLPLVLLLACGPSEEERRVEEAMAAINYRWLSARFDSIVAEAPTPDSVLALSRSPLADSLVQARRRLEAARR